MHISDLVGQYNRSVSQSGSASGSKGVERLVSSISDLSKGNVFEGTVVSVKGGRVILALSNGQQISARLDSKLMLSTGQSMFFQVKSNNGNQVEIRPYTAEGVGGNLTLIQALKAAGLPVENEYLSMVNKMMEENMPIDKDSVAAMAKAVQDNPFINIDTLVQMEKLGIKPTPEMASQFENYLQDKQAINQTIEGFIDELGKTLANEKMSERDLCQMTSEVLSIIAEQQTEGKPVGKLAEALTKALQEIFPQLSNENVQATETGQSEAAQESANPREAAHQSGNPQEAAQQSVNPQEAANQGVNQPEAAQESTNPQDTAQQSGNPQEVAQQSVTLQEAKQQGENQPEAANQGENQSEVAQQEAAKTEDRINLSQELTANQTLSQVERLLRFNQPMDKTKLIAFLSGNSFNELLKAAIQEQWLLNPGKVSDSNQINRLYEKIENQLERLVNAVKVTGQDGSNLTNLATEIRNNVEFMNQINEAYTYIQIPLKMSGHSASGELYVYTNKKQLQEGDKDLTAFLHLDMEHLGGTDVSVKLHGKDVTTNFYMDSDEAYALLQSFLPQLEERLKKKGYNCSITVFNEEKHVNFVENFLKKDQPSIGKLHRYSFDMRA
ncbi:MAG: flagellar hook-length control protein FliK [Agathobacter sp.]|nr:flagellar hook-length control protein FliK [Agathobacter sp.]